VKQEVSENGGELDVNSEVVDSVWQLKPPDPRQGAASFCLGQKVFGDFCLWIVWKI